MTYWHRDEDGRWYFDWSHLWPVFAIVIVLLLIVLRGNGADLAPEPRPVGPIGYDEAVKAALADARSRPSGDAAYTRYLLASNYAGAGDAEFLEQLRAVTDYQVNSLSRLPRIVRTRKVTPWLWALDVRDYGESFAKAWEAFERDNPFFLIPVKEEVVEVSAPAPVQPTPAEIMTLGDGKKYRKVNGVYVEHVPLAAAPVEKVVQKARDVFRRGPWVPPADFDPLSALTGSKTPLVHADHFFDRTSSQKGRKGNGYLDFLGLQKTKTVKDLDDLIRFRDADAVETQREIFAVVRKSIVAENPRQIDRKPAVTGARWRTGDTDDPTGDGSALDRLFEAYKVKAREYVATLPNGLPVTFLANGGDKTQDVAPADIVSNKKALDRVTEIRVGTVDCLLCHGGALAPVSDHKRKVYADKTGLRMVIVDPDLKRRAEYAYLTKDFDDEFEADQKRFDKKYKEATGLETTKELVEAVTSVFVRQRVDHVTLKAAAARAGVTPDELKAALRADKASKAKFGTPSDEILGTLAPDDGAEEPVPPQVFKERFPVLMLIVLGVNP